MSDRPAGAAGGLDRIFLDLAAQRRRAGVVAPQPDHGQATKRLSAEHGLSRHAAAGARRSARQRAQRDATTIVFSTGATFPPFSIHGRVFDWAGQRPANGAYIEAISQRDTSLVYITATDTAGHLRRRAAAGGHVPRARADRPERQSHRRPQREVGHAHRRRSRRSSQSIELDAIERDSLPPNIDNVTMIDSVHAARDLRQTARPAMPLQPALVRCSERIPRRSRSTRVEWQAAFDRHASRRFTRAQIRHAHESRRLAEPTTRARGDTTRAAAPLRRRADAAPVLAPATTAAEAQESLPPDRGIVLTAVADDADSRPNTSYTITTRGFRNLVGTLADAISRTFTTPKPPPPPDRRRSRLPRTRRDVRRPAPPPPPDHLHALIDDRPTPHAAERELAPREPRRSAAARARAALCRRRRDSTHDRPGARRRRSRAAERRAPGPTRSRRPSHAATRPSLRRVINGTGVVLHTNLGRAPLAQAAVDAVDARRVGFSNLEYDIDRGERGSRYTHCAALLRELTGAEDALVVNNCAAALVLVLNTFAERPRRDRLARRADRDRRKLSHPRHHGEERRAARRSRDDEPHAPRRLPARARRRDGNHRQGAPQQLRASPDSSPRRRRASSARSPPSDGIPLLHDLGSGLLLSLDDYGLRGEPTGARRGSRRGPTGIVTMSGDKLLGGPQAGIILGSRDAIDRVQKNPLTRSYRVDKLTLAALEATLALYRDPARAIREIPALAQLTADLDSLRQRAEQRSRATQLATRSSVIDSEASVGGGAFPTARIPSIALAIAGDADGDRSATARGDPPLVARVTDGRVIVDLRTIFPVGGRGRSSTALRAALQ